MEWSVTIALRTHSTLNQREHWARRARRARHERLMGRVFCPRGVTLPLEVTLVRVAPRPLDDDNLAASFKALRDGVADRIGVKDNHPGLRWKYTQRRGAPKEYAVEMKFAEIGS